MMKCSTECPVSYVGQFLVENNLTYMSTTQLNVYWRLYNKKHYIHRKIIEKI